MSEPQDNNEATNDVALLIRYLQQDQLEKQSKRQNPMGLTTIYARRVVLLWLLCGVIGVMVLIILAGAIVSLKTREPTADTSLFHRFNVQSVTPADKALTPQLARWGQQIYQAQIEHNDPLYRAQATAILPQIMAPFNLCIILLLLAKMEIVPDEGQTNVDRIALGDVYPSAFDREMNQLLETLLASSFSIVNWVIVDKRLSLDPASVAWAKTIFHAEIIGFNVSTPEELVAKMENKVRHIMAGHLSYTLSENGLIVMSMAHFSAAWVRPFARNLTTLQPFYSEIEDNVVSPVTLMRVYARFPYTEYEQYVIIDLPLCSTYCQKQKPRANEDYILTLILPRYRNISVLSIARRINWWPLISRHIDFASSPYLDLSLPRFTLDQDTVVDNPLDDTRTKDGSQARVPHAIMEKISMTVNEDGLATRSPITAPADKKPVDGARVVKANRPFLYIIWHPTTQLALFVGTVRHVPHHTDNNAVAAK